MTEAEQIKRLLEIYKDRVKNTTYYGKDLVEEFLAFLEKQNLEIRYKHEST